jgi:hypothetical protein
MFLLAFACRQEDFSPIKDFQNKFVVYCVLDSRTDSIKLFIQKNSDKWNETERINLPLDLQIKINCYNNKIYNFTPSDSTTHPEYKSYYTREFDRHMGYYHLEIISRDFPPSTALVFYPVASLYLSSKKKAGIYVEIRSSTKQFKLHAYVYYDLKINNTWVRRRVEFPLSKTSGKERIDYYPGADFLEEYPYLFEVNDDIINNTIYAKILPLASKEDIEIIDGRLIVENFDDNLAQYLKAVNGFYDQYTVRVDQFGYSNIMNGIGIFGAYRADTFMLFENSAKYSLSRK